MQLKTTSPESKFPNEYSDVIFIQIDQHLKKLLQKYKGVPILWNTVYVQLLIVIFFVNQNHSSDGANSYYLPEIFQSRVICT